MLIAGIWMILVRSNKELAKACEEGSDPVQKPDLDQTEAFSLETDLRQADGLSMETGHHEADGLSMETGHHQTDGLSVETDSGQADAHSLKAGLQEDPPPIILIRYDENRRIEESRRVETLPYVIGRDPDCDMVLSDLGVAKRHCVIDYIDGKYLLTDNGTHNRLLVGDRQVDQAELTDGIGLFIGSTEFSIKYTA